MSVNVPTTKSYDLPHEEEVLDLLRAHRVTRARLFGSAARNELGPESDIDLMIEVEAPVRYGVLLTLSEALEEITGRKMDVVFNVNPVFWPFVEQDLVELPI